ncbi:hypothetical protein RIR_jg11606.t1 [Rhizophagus irregularis DAOM 181602=DAOM 197198]|uniref:Uncharacterized protein n=1 Tax=Rhizophagus irregularis (strain DAOM 181602 / DAOM 197198 / MUCL 43194) TaxID=747089 RepID=U9UH82_RHIID|nr:hypothetical protein RIR_jg11606.t1 [Rhizophagus irregularis DAOM 181602=DAOM 197198]
MEDPLSSIFTTFNSKQFEGIIYRWPHDVTDNTTWESSMIFVRMDSGALSVGYKLGDRFPKTIQKCNGIGIIKDVDQIEGTPHSEIVIPDGPAAEPDLN